MEYSYKSTQRVLEVMRPQPFLRLGELLNALQRVLFERKIVRFEPGKVDLGVVAEDARRVLETELGSFSERDVGKLVYYWIERTFPVREAVPLMLLDGLWSVWVGKNGVWGCFLGDWVRVRGVELTCDDAVKLLSFFSGFWNRYGVLVDFARVVGDGLPSGGVYSYLRGLLKLQEYRIKVSGSGLSVFLPRLANEIGDVKYYVRAVTYPVPRNSVVDEEFRFEVAMALPVVFSSVRVPCRVVREFSRFAGLCDCEDSEVDVVVRVDGVTVRSILEGGKKIYDDGAWVGKSSLVTFGEVEEF